MGAYRPKDGDRVRVVLEGEVFGASKLSDNFTVGFNRIRPDDAHVVSVEKLEPPVVTFKPGDKIRGRYTGSVYTVGVGGYLNHQTGQWCPDEYETNSALFELVD